ncbi:unnamed protein product, partial [Discosporangium mesarthrocarpum]
MNEQAQLPLLHWSQRVQAVISGWELEGGIDGVEDGTQSFLQSMRSARLLSRSAPTLPFQSERIDPCPLSSQSTPKMASGGDSFKRRAPQWPSSTNAVNLLSGSPSSTKAHGGGQHEHNLSKADGQWNIGASGTHLSGGSRPINKGDFGRSHKGRVERNTLMDPWLRKKECERRLKKNNAFINRTISGSSTTLT